MENLTAQESKLLAERYGLDFANKIEHAFARSGHNVESLVTQFGSEAQAFVRIQKIVDSMALPNGVTNQVVSVGGQNITVRVFVENGIKKITTFYKP
jgi:hypothetical protein